MGAANILWVPLANTFGRRPVNLFNILLLLLCCVWAARATSFGSLLAARFFMGVGVAPADTSPVLGGIAGGYIGGNLGLAWIHWVNVILCGILLVACFFLVPETLYARETIARPIDPSLDEDGKGEDGTNAVKIEDIAQNRHIYSELTFIRSLKLYTYHGNLLQNFIAPWLTLRLPGVWLVMFWYAGLVGGIVTISTVGPTLAAKPPYLWGNNAGLILVGGIVGALLGAVVTALSADRIITTKKTLRGEENMEPESRLPVALPGLILATTGLWTFGFCAQSPNPHMWIGMQFGLGMLSFGLMQAPSIGFNYV
ncbi:hypothetical protein APSETT445_002377 [Aspergillus pseudonomiae]